MGKLDGIVTLITYSGRNIGRATALKLAGEGTHIVVNARTNQAEPVAHEIRDLGLKAVATASRSTFGALDMTIEQITQCDTLTVRRDRRHRTDRKEVVAEIIEPRPAGRSAKP